jgi:hypothetical protein
MVVAVLTLVMVSPALAGPGKPTVIQPPASSAQTGKTYGELAAAWWQTMLRITTAKNPQNDSSGDNCQGGNTPQIFFLAGSAPSPSPPGSPNTPVKRTTCTVPATKPIFFPIINGECSNLEQSPFFGETDADRAECAKTLIDGVSIGSLKVTLDGRAIPNLGRFRAASPPFDFTVPPDNILGVPASTNGHSSADGFWVLLKPLAPGTHVIHFEGAVVSGPAAGFTQNVTYNLTVQ